MSAYNWQDLTVKLNQLLAPKTPSVAMKFYLNKDDMQVVPKVRYTKKKHAFCQFIGQARYLGWSVGIYPENMTIDYCKTINGLFPVDQRFTDGKIVEGVWHADAKNSMSHHAALNIVPKQYEGVIMTPLGAGKLEDPDVCLHYLNSGQLFLLMAGYLFNKHEKLSFDFVGESTCSDSWMRTLITGKPSIGVPCFAERKFAGVQDEEMALALTPAQLDQAIKGTEQLNKNGLRYPFAPYSVFCDTTEGFPPAYLQY